jgi:hypothetical protein
MEIFERLRRKNEEENEERRREGKRTNKRTTEREATQPIGLGVYRRREKGSVSSNSAIVLSPSLAV